MRNCLYIFVALLTALLGGDASDAFALCRRTIQERSTNGAVLVTYTRGLDLSGSLSGAGLPATASATAGGIGGLLARTDSNGSTFYHADGNGNITALMDGSENIAARYLYGPFGKLIGQWGPMAGVNEMRFSSMPYYSNPDNYGYGGRFYGPNLQRWLNQDPIGERGGINLYRAMNNNPVNYVDPYGLEVGLHYPVVNGQPTVEGPNINLSLPTVPFSGGVLVSGEVEGGAGAGAGAQWSGDGGLFYDPNAGVTAGGFQSAGAAAGILNYSVSAVGSPSCPGQKAPVVFAGSSIGGGSGLWFSNAGSPTDLGGPFDQMNFNTPLFSLSYAQSGDTWIFSFTMSGGAKYAGGGFSGSAYPTTTYSAGGYNLLSGQPAVYEP